jgi:hypothetical protein
MKEIIDLLARLKAKSDNLQPDAALKQQLLARFSTPAPSVPLWQRAVPTWAVAASWFLVGGGYCALQTPFLPPTPVIVTKLLHDTVFQTKTVFLKNKTNVVLVHDTVFLEPKPLFLAPPTLAEERQPLPYFEDTITTPLGKTLAEDSLTWAILMRITN